MRRLTMVRRPTITRRSSVEAEVVAGDVADRPPTPPAPPPILPAYALCRTPQGTPARVSADAHTTRPCDVPAFRRALAFAPWRHRRKGWAGSSHPPHHRDRAVTLRRDLPGLRAALADDHEFVRGRIEYTPGNDVVHAKCLCRYRL